MTAWDDLNARARGLGTHLLGRLALEGMARAPDLPTVAAELERYGYLIEESARSSGPELELAARRVIAARLHTLARWAGRRTDILAILFEDEDRRSISALVRGAVQRAPAELRLSGLLPTPGLPGRALEELAHQPTPAAVASLLALWRHPLAAALIPEATRAEPDLLRIETSLGRAFASRALNGARRSGRGGVLHRYVQQVIDLDNAYAALILAEEKEPLAPADHWVPGGRAIPLILFQSAVATRSAAAAGRRLASGFRGSRLADAFAEPNRSTMGLERAVLAIQIAELNSLARTDPLSPAPLLAFALRQRAEVLDVRWLVWGISLGAPSGALIEGLVTPS
jgi:V/A-type H+-transporting ATPase subunit C